MTAGDVPVTGTPGALVGVIMGSVSDWDTMRGAAETLRRFGVPFEAEVVSAHERDLAVALGATPGDIIVNGPLKSDVDLLWAHQHGAVLNLDSIRLGRVGQTPVVVNGDPRARIPGRGGRRGEVLTGHEIRIVCRCRGLLERANEILRCHPRHWWAGDHSDELILAGNGHDRSLLDWP